VDSAVQRLVTAGLRLRFIGHGLAQLAISSSVERGMECLLVEHLLSLRESSFKAFALELRHRKPGSGS